MSNLAPIIRFLKHYDGDEITLMEVCGTHTAAIAENGIPDLISDRIKLVSGPGCPVCVTASSYIDRLIELACKENTCVVTFGDMIRVRGKSKSLRDISAEGGNIKMVYSPLDVVNFAKNDPDTTYIFAAVGFETTTPVYAILVDEAIKRNVHNVKILTALKTMPEAIETVYNDNKRIDGFIAPGHVSVITGSNMFVPLAEKLGIPFVISGFEGEQLLLTIYLLIKERNHGIVRNVYLSAVTKSGNALAKRMVGKYFKKCDAMWRGMGIIKNSGLILKDEFAEYDAGSADLIEDVIYNKGCSCGKIVAGAMPPTECALFGTACTTSTPQGACMVSTEGACYNYYTNRRR